MPGYSISAGSQFIVECEEIVGQGGGMVDVNHIVLMAPGSVTHHFDMSARYVLLPGSRLSQYRIQVQLPLNGSLPRGFYMCFALSSSGIPSTAVWIKVT
jgi:hypothetical protein